MILDCDKCLTLSVTTAVKPTRLYLCILAAILIVPLFIQKAVAEDAESSKPEQPRWFEVEVILYKANSEIGLTDESWAVDTEFSLPEQIIDFLQPLSQPEPLKPHDESSSERSTISKQATELLRGSNTPSKHDSSNNMPLANEQEISEQLDQIKLDIELEKPFILLAETAFQLESEARRISKNSRYTLLSHFSWRQPVLGRRDSPSIRIAGGTDFQDSFDYTGTEKTEYLEETVSEQDQLNADESIQEIIKTSAEIGENSNEENQITLENEQQFVPVALPWVPEIDGSMRVYIQRKYLHIDTKLFYRRPDKEEVTALDLAQSMLISNGSYFPLNKSPQEIFSEPSMIQAPMLSGIKAIENNSSAVGSSNASDISDASNISAANDLAASKNQNNNLTFKFDEEFLHRESEKIYITRLFNYPLKQTRRLRSGELHYFDHPLIGMLVMIRPYERFIEEELEDLDSNVVDATLLNNENRSEKSLNTGPSGVN